MAWSGQISVRQFEAATVFGLIIGTPRGVGAEGTGVGLWPFVGGLEEKNHIFPVRKRHQKQPKFGNNSHIFVRRFA